MIEGKCFGLNVCSDGWQREGGCSSKCCLYGLVSVGGQEGGWKMVNNSITQTDRDGRMVCQVNRHVDRGRRSVVQWWT